MATIDDRWKLRFVTYSDALKTVEEVIPRYDQLTELEKDGLIQRFKYTFDLSLKVMQDYLKSAGYVDLKGPRSCIKQMAQVNVIDGFEWEEILNARNELSHIYDEAKCRGYLENVIHNFVPAFRDFRLKMEHKL